jgi:hypothetical protein
LQERSALGDRAHQRGREHDGGVLVGRDLGEGLQVAELVPPIPAARG